MIPPNVDLNGLRALYVLLHEKSVSRAAEQLGITQSAASNALKKLRKQFDDELLTRAGRDMIRTTLAEALLPDLTDLMEATHRILTPHGPIDPQKLKAPLRIVTSDHVELALMPHLEALLKTEAPHVALHLRAPTPNLWDDLRDDRLDLVVGPFFESAPGDMSVQGLFTSPFVCILRKDHPFAQAPLTLERYLDLEHLLIAPQGGMTGRVDEALGERGLKRNVTRTVGQFSVAPFIVVQRDFVCTLPRRMAEAAARYLPLAILPPPIPIAPVHIRQIWHRRHHAHPRHQWYRQALERAARIMEQPSDIASDPPNG